MYRGPEVQPFAQAPRVTPADTLPVHGGEPPMSLEQATIKMHNPLQPTAQNHLLRTMPRRDGPG